MKKFLLVLSAVVIVALSIAPIRHALAFTNTSYYWGVNGNSSLLTADQGGGIELGATGSTSEVNPVSGGIPYIDFHYGNGTNQDYNARLLNGSDGNLEVSVHQSGQAEVLDAVFGQNGTTLNRGISPAGSAVKHVRVSGCTTGSSYLDTCTITITWPGTAFLDTSYTTTCTINGAHTASASIGAPWEWGVVQSSATTTSINIVVRTNTDGNAITVPGFNCMAMHD